MSRGDPAFRVGNDALDAGVVQLARSLRGLGLHVIGLIPAGEHRVGRRGRRSAGEAVHAVALPLAVALSELSGQRIVCVRWFGPAPEPASADRAAWQLHEVSERVGLLTPVRPERSGWAGPDLATVTEACRSEFEHVVVDLTGLERTGELARAVAAVDGTAIVASVGMTREAEIVATGRALDGYPLLGVVLVGPHTTREQR